MPDQDITDLLIAHRQGEQRAFERLVPLVYEDLRRIAHHPSSTPASPVSSTGA